MGILTVRTLTSVAAWVWAGRQKLLAEFCVLGCYQPKHSPFVLGVCGYGCGPLGLSSYKQRRRDQVCGAGINSGLASDTWEIFPVCKWDVG